MTTGGTHVHIIRTTESHTHVQTHTHTHTHAQHQDHAHGMTPAEFDAAFTAAMPRLRRRLLALTGNPHDADDLLQETYLRLSRRARSHTLAHQRHPYAYTCAAAMNLLRDSWLHPSRRERCTDRLPEESWDGGLASREAEAAAIDLLRGLSPKEAAAVILVDLEGLTHDGAAERLGAHRGTVQRNRMRGHAKIRAALGSYGTAPGPVPSTKSDGGADPMPASVPRTAAA
ncbi:RNA polymerase sigma factor [Streptomyces coeruleoprunus]|uniref:RNA polymerase sigma factor n=1 Tax=Streptomyces coeruleoprunus TaxID=285563 RepID=A0ABV9X8M2_9ACTN